MEKVSKLLIIFLSVPNDDFESKDLIAIEIGEYLDAILLVQFSCGKPPVLFSSLTARAARLAALLYAHFMRRNEILRKFRVIVAPWRIRPTCGIT